MALILIVDDREPEREYLVSLLRHAGYAVIQAQDGFDALEMMSTTVPNLVITDILMPTMDGFEFARRMRERTETQAVPLIFYTASYDESATRLFVANRIATTILPKPCEPQLVLQTVDRVLKEPQQQAAILGDEFRSAHLELVTTRLHQKVNDLERANRELLALNEELERRNDILRQFAYATAHDLQEPLRNVVNAAEMVSMTCTNVMSEDGAVFLAECVEGARRMHAMIKDLLAYTTVIDDSEVTPTLTDTNEALRDVLTNLNVAILEAGAEVQFDNLPVLAIGRAHVIQLFQNLIGNGLKYRRKGVQPVIRISATCSEGRCTFQVADNGIGFNPEYAERIFKVFKRLHQRREYSGTGIGLAICARIVEHYQGRIWAEGHPNEGATFWFTVPVEPDRACRGI